MVDYEGRMGSARTSRGGSCRRPRSGGHRALSTFEHLPASELDAGFARFAADAERDPDRVMPVYPATMLVLSRPS